MSAALAPVRLPPRGRSLLELDPDLGDRLAPERLAAAQVELVVRSVRLPRGEWAAGPSPDHFGLLITAGALACEVMVGDVVSTELLGPGDLIRPSSTADGDLLARRTRWQVLADAQLAVLHTGFASALPRYPEVNAMLLDRLNARVERLATMKPIAQLKCVDRRLSALFWHLAERWGRMSPDGVVLPLGLSHRLLGELVGARRPTVSAALALLIGTGEVVRRPDGTWLLAGRPVEFVGSPRATAHRRVLLRS
jgi:CRP/FNR family transcriptional regulator, cyclic AMP receptor protein